MGKHSSGKHSSIKKIGQHVFASIVFGWNQGVNKRLTVLFTSIGQREILLNPCMFLMGKGKQTFTQVGPW